MANLRTLVHWLAHSATAFWLLLALLTFGGIFLSTLGWVINVIMGIIFGLIGVFFRVRGQSLKALLEEGEQKPIGLFLQTEIVLLLGVNLVAIVLLSAALSRIFGEGLPLFG